MGSAGLNIICSCWLRGEGRISRTGLALSDALHRTPFGRFHPRTNMSQNRKDSAFASVDVRCFYQIWWIIHFPLSNAKNIDFRACDLCDEHLCAFRPSTTFGLFVPLLTK